MKVEGYAVVCDNDCIADAGGYMPDSLKSEAEWAYFQAGLDAADVIVLGRKSHEVTLNPKNRKRLVMTSSVNGAVAEGQTTVFWNPEGASLKEAVGLLGEGISSVAVTGGKRVFDYFLRTGQGYCCFHLSRMQDIYLRGGVKLFSALDPSGQTPEGYLESLGYKPSNWQALDARASVVQWRQSD